MKLSTKIGGKWTFSVIWVKLPNRGNKVLHTRITYQRTNNVTPSIYPNSHSEEFLLLKRLAEIAFDLGYEGKELIQFVIEYKNELSGAFSPHIAVELLQQQIKDLDFEKRKFKREIQKY